MQVNEELSTLVGPHLPADRCPLTYFVLNVANPLIFAVVLPLHELVVYPVFHKYILSMMRRAVVGYVLGVAAVIGATVVASVSSRSFCSFFTEQGEFSGLHEWMVFVPILVSTFSEMLIFIPGKSSSRYSIKRYPSDNYFPEYSFRVCVCPVSLQHAWTPHRTLLCNDGPSCRSVCPSTPPVCQDLHRKHRGARLLQV